MLKNIKPLSRVREHGQNLTQMYKANISFQKEMISLSKQLDADEICWVLMLLTLPKINKILMDSDMGREFKERKRAERTVH